MEQHDFHRTDVFLCNQKNQTTISEYQFYFFVNAVVENVKELTGDIQRQIKEKYKHFWPIQLQLTRTQVFYILDNI